MFSSARMVRLSLLVLQHDERSVLRALAASRAVQLDRSVRDDEGLCGPRDRAAELAHCLTLLGRVEELRRGLALTPTPSLTCEGPLRALPETEAELQQMEQTTGALLQRRQTCLERNATAVAECEQVAPYLGTELPLGPPGSYAFLSLLAGTAPLGTSLRLESAVAGRGELVPLRVEGGRQRFIVLTTPHDRAALETRLQSEEFQVQPLPVFERQTSDSLYERSVRGGRQASAELHSVRQDLASLSRNYAPVLAEMEQRLLTEHGLLQVEQSLSRTEAAVLIGCWVPADELAAIKTRLWESVGGRLGWQADTPERDQREAPPTLLRHPPWLRPFGRLVSAYGLPGYQELDPTLLVACSFLLMFGLMFGDAGQGAILALGGLAAWRFCTRPALRDAGWLALLAGTFSCGFGLVYGSYFGLPGLKKYALWRDPLEGDPMTLMAAAVGIGVALISLGLVLNTVNRWRCRDLRGALLEKFGLGGLLFYWGALLLVLQFGVLRSRGLVHLVVLFCLGLPVLGWLLSGPVELMWRRRQHQGGDGDGLFGAVLESAVGAFEAILSYLANTISFVRLAAYAMSHAALLAAAFMLADSLRHLPGAGGALSLLIIIAGNLIALVLEGLIASVQALRLEYYEFFGKFYSAEGRPFEPFALVKLRA